MIKLNGTELIFGQFPNGETNVDGEAIYKLVKGKLNVVDFKYESDSDLIKLLIVKRHLDSIVTDKCILDIRYMPYSRQDRVEGKSVFTLKHIADFINSLNFTFVTVSEPHSDVTTALVNFSEAIYPTVDLLLNVLSEIDFDPTKDYLFYPDAGALKRYSKLIKGNYRTLVGFKDRDFATGRITNLQVVGDTCQLQGAKVLIIDDLCSYGGTFMLSAGELKNLGAKEVYLLVSHCENSIFEGNTLDNNSPVTKVFTTDSILTEKDILLNDLSKIKVYRGGK